MSGKTTDDAYWAILEAAEDEIIAERRYDAMSRDELRIEVDILRDALRDLVSDMQSKQCDPRNLQWAKDALKGNPR